MPNGAPDFNDVPRSLAAIWGEMRAMNTTINDLPCKEHSATIRENRAALDRASGERGVILKALPYVLAALGLGAATGVIGQRAATPAPAPRPATLASP